MRLLRCLEQDRILTLNDITDEYQRLVNLKRDTFIQSGGHSGSAYALHWKSYPAASIHPLESEIERSFPFRAMEIPPFQC